MKNKQDSRLAGGNRNRSARAWRAAAAAALLVAGLLDAGAATDSNVALTKHNLSKSGSGTGAVKSASETQICAFCHTPHGANTSAPAPLWNKTGSGNTYTTYKSTSLDADNLDAQGYLPQPAGSSLMCLSCHDGTVALSNVRVLNGKTPVTIPVSNASAVSITNAQVGATTAVGGMPVGSGETTGFTRLLGTNLSNDHPISVNYDNSLSGRDGELRNLDSSQRYPAGAPASGTKSVIGLRSSGVSPHLPLLPTGPDGTGQVQCATCHDPHIIKSKFLRLNRMQTVSPGGGEFLPASDIICLACHDKGGAEWASSAHANSATANETYQLTPANQREFPDGSSTQVWQAACLNCHDTHTVAGANRLLREGTNSTSSPKRGGKSAIEETCFQCHAPNAATTVTVSGKSVSTPGSVLAAKTLSTNDGVPDIWTEFTKGRRMPLRDWEQGGSIGTNELTEEPHKIRNADFVEQPADLGLGFNSRRHAECTDCHNPHRVIRNARYDGGGADQRTHVAGGTSAAKGADGNIASGVLRGIWGVEPTYGTVSTWPKAPTYAVVSGIPGKAATPLTKEYQLCLKCHSDYSNLSFPNLGHAGGTPSNTNGMTKYTNVAAEFAANAWDTPTSGGDQGEYGEGSLTGAQEDSTAIEPDQTTADLTSGDMTDDTAGVQNHRSWHPVIKPTGRTRDERRMQTTGGNFRAPFGTNVGTQTMHCSDCHGNNGGVEATTSNTANSWTRDSGPNLAKVQGPHGSSANFLLKGDWSTSVTIGGDGLCFNCHNPTAGNSGTGDGAGRPSGFNDPGSEGGGGHGNEHGSKRCMRCHVAVPHGWRNKAFLVNLNCVGGEGGKTGDCVSHSEGSLSYEPYYYEATLRVKTWRASGNWTIGSCGKGSNAGRDWMRSVC